MIKVDIIAEKIKAPSTAIFWVVGVILLLFAVFIGLFYFHSSLNTQLVARKEQLESMKIELTQLEKKTKEVKELESKRKVLREKLAIIARLKKERYGSVKMLDDLSKTIPKQVWLLTLRDRNAELKIKGRALSNEAIATFMKRLEKSPYFKNVELLETRHIFLIQKKQKTPEGTRILHKEIKYDRSFKGKGAWIEEFSLTAKIVYAGELTEDGDKKNLKIEKKDRDD